MKAGGNVKIVASLGVTNDGPEENDCRFCCHCGRKIAEYVYLEEISFAEED